MKGECGPGELHGKILNAIFTMFRTHECARDPSVPASGQEVGRYDLEA